MRLCINAQLVDTKTDFPLWSERYDREMKDVFEVQDDIAHSIADALRITLTPHEQQSWRSSRRRTCRRTTFIFAGAVTRGG